MPDHISIATWNVLLEFGFTADSSIFSNLRTGLNYDFGNFKLSASFVMNKSLVDVVLFTGVMASRLSVAEVVFELPRFVESREQCAALMVWNLDQCADGHVFQPARAVAWVQEGRDHKDLLPWERERAKSEQAAEEYRARPHCTAERDWLKLALKSLARHLTQIEDSEPVEVSFDGKVLSFRVAGNVVVLAAVGSPWTSSFSLPAGKLRRLPKRLMNAHVDVSVWRSWLNIDRWRYDGIVEPEELPKQQEDS